MTTKDLISSIIESMPEGLTKLEKARYIYIELGKQRRFDTRYYYGNAKERRRLQKEAQRMRMNRSELRNKRTILCITLSEIYKMALEEVGIDCDIVRNGFGGDKHVIPILMMDDETRGKIKIRADLQQDLEAIQTGMSTVEFGTINRLERHYDVINEEELKRIDKKIGYIQEHYRDIDIDKAKEEVSKMDANESLRYILESSALCGNNHFNGQVERRKYYRFLLDTVIPYYTDKKVFMFSCYREKENADELEEGEEKRDYTLCAFSYEKDEAHAYLYSAKEERFLPIELEKLVELQEEGLVLGTRRKTNGVNLLKKLIREDQKRKRRMQESQEPEIIE